MHRGFPQNSSLAAAAAARPHWRADAVLHAGLGCDQLADHEYDGGYGTEGEYCNEGW